MLQNFFPCHSLRTKAGVFVPNKFLQPSLILCKQVKGPALILHKTERSSLFAKSMSETKKEVTLRPKQRTLKPFGIQYVWPT